MTNNSDKLLELHEQHNKYQEHLRKIKVALSNFGHDHQLIIEVNLSQIHYPEITVNKDDNRTLDYPVIFNLNGGELQLVTYGRYYAEDIKVMRDLLTKWLKAGV